MGSPPRTHWSIRLGPIGLLLWLVALSGTQPARSAEVVFAAYNLQNYFVTDRVAVSGTLLAKAKQQKSIEAQVRIISQIKPDILGVCEMGSPEDFGDFKARLKHLGYKDAEYVPGADPERHLALVSRFPIVARNSRSDVPYELGGVPEKVKRGFLDVTIRISPEQELRCVGVHLKSKLPAPEGEALMRRQEAHLLREYLNQILSDTPTIPLLVYGDLNDTKNEPAVQEILAPRGAPASLKDLLLRDEQGDRWTYYWKQADVYSRIDFLLANSVLLRQIGKSRIYRSLDWSEASDHRPIITTIHVPNK